MPLNFEELEIERSPTRRVYRVRIPGDQVAARVAERLNEIGRTVRLPGFRPGKIPLTVLEQHYGTKARAEVIQKLGAEAADSTLPRQELAESIEVIADAADAVEFRLAVTHLPELPPLDFDAIQIERLLGPASAAAMLEDHLRQSVLDHLDKAYRFSLAPQLVAREHAIIRHAAEEAVDSISEEMDTELRAIAERRVRLGAVVVEMARRYEIVPIEEELHSERRGTETLAQTRDRLREERVVALILSKAKIVDREATEEELRES